MYISFYFVNKPPIIVYVVVVVVSSTPSDANRFSSWEVNAFAALDFLTESLLTKRPDFPSMPFLQLEN